MLTSRSSSLVRNEPNAGTDASIDIGDVDCLRKALMAVRLCKRSGTFKGILDVRKRVAYAMRFCATSLAHSSDPCGSDPVDSAPGRASIARTR